jgi:hypothetical protein
VAREAEDSRPDQWLSRRRRHPDRGPQRHAPEPGRRVRADVVEFPQGVQDGLPLRDCPCRQPRAVLTADSALNDLFCATNRTRRRTAESRYIPDGRGACQGQQPLRKGMHVTVDDDLIIWLTKELAD